MFSSTPGEIKCHDKYVLGTLLNVELKSRTFRHVPDNEQIKTTHHFLHIGTHNGKH